MEHIILFFATVALACVGAAYLGNRQRLNELREERLVARMLLWKH